MKLVLVAGFKPSIQNVGPTILLYPGWWKIVGERVVDSKLSLVHSGVSTPVDDKPFLSTGGSYHLSVEAGTEEYINVFAEVTNEPDASTIEGRPS